MSDKIVMVIKVDNYQKSLTKMTNLIKDREELKELKKIEEEIFNDKDIIPFIITFNDAQEEYNFVLTHFKNDEEKKEIARNKLIEAKRNMDSLEKVKKYNELYDIISKDTLYLEMSLKEILKNGDKKEC